MGRRFFLVLMHITKHTACFIFILALLIYAALIYAKEDRYAAVRTQLDSCVACHGKNGVSVIPQNPILAGQHLYYLYTQLRDFKSGSRENAVMRTITQTLEKEDMLLIAEYFSEQKWPQNRLPAVTKKEAAQGKSIVNQGQCVQCHLGGFEGASGVPRVSGQHSVYIEKTLLDFKNRIRNNSPAKNSLMAGFSDADIKAVSAYITNMPL